CLSGDIHDLNDQQWRIVTEGMEFYQKISPIIKKGFSYRFGPAVSSYRYPEGWQVVFRVAADRDQALAVVHSFAGDNQEPIRIPVPENLELDVEAVYAENQAAPDIKGGEIHFPLGGGFQAMAVLFRIRGGR
ncbi:MAG: alpha-galactosidase, partial [Limnochordia bacterium]